MPTTSTAKKTTPCQEACAVGIDIPRYIRCIRTGKFGEALAVIREKLPFPTVCGYACVQPCEANCARNQLDEPLAIRLLKRAAVEKSGDPEIKTAPATGKKVAVVGAGPSGLTCAYYLARKGHQVTVFEAMPEPGGMMRYGIPAYRLPREALSRDIEAIRAAGAEIKTNSKVESAQQLLEEGFDAVYLAFGAWKSMSLNIKGEDLPGVLDGLTLLKEVNSGQKVAVGKRVGVIGGGNTAIDVARSTIRLGAKEVSIIYRRTRDEMPASAEEINGAIEEGVKMEFLTTPVKISAGAQGLKLTCQRIKLGPKDKSGRPRPVPIEGSAFEMFFDTVVTAVGQKTEMPAGLSLPLDEKGLIQVDPDTLETSRRGLFAGGDAVGGPASVIEAAAYGRRAAASMDKFLGGSGVIEEVFAPPEELEKPHEPLPEGTGRPIVPAIPLGQRLKSFATVELGYTEAAAKKEARRCLECERQCYHVEVDTGACKECGYCVEVCRLGVFAEADFYNERGYKPVMPVRQDKCISCQKCFFACPDFAITISKVQTCREVC